MVAAVVFGGFAHSFYLKAWFGTRALAPVLHVHGLVMTAWVALFITQIFLVEKHRTDIHRRLGILGAAMAVLIVVLGIDIIARDILRAAPDAGPAAFSLLFVAFDGPNLLVFFGLVCCALLTRRRPDYHKRLMLLGTICLLPPALGRIMERVAPGNVPFEVLGAMTLGVVACIALDTLRHHRFHPALAWGGGLVIFVSVARCAAELTA